MKYSQLDDEIANLTQQIAELQIQIRYLRSVHSLPRSVFYEGYSFEAKWHVSPEEGLSYTMRFFKDAGKSKKLVFECAQGEFFRTASGEVLAHGVEARAREVQRLLVLWLTDQIDWPFSEEEFPRVT